MNMIIIDKVRYIKEFIVVFIILMLLITGCGVLIPPVDEKVFVKKYGNATLNSDLKLEISEHDVRYYQLIHVMIDNNTEGDLSIDTDKDLRIFSYDETLQDWESVSFTHIKSNDESNPLHIIGKGESLTIAVIPNFADASFSRALRIVAIAEQFTSSRFQIGNSIQIRIKPASNYDPQQISIKREIDQLKKIAKDWKEDSYLARIKVDVPIKNKDNLVAFIAYFQTPSDPHTELYVQKYYSGMIDSYTSTDSEQNTLAQPLEDTDWMIDVPGAFSIFSTLASDITWPSPLGECHHMILSHNDFNQGKVTWEYWAAKCGEEILGRYFIDPVTGEITMIYEDGITKKQ